MMTAVKWLGILLVSALLLAVLLIAFMDWNRVKDYAVRTGSEMTGRTLTIEGDMDIDWSWKPRVRLEGIRFENAAWSKEPHMVELAALAFRIDLGKLLTGQVVIPELILERPRVLLEVSPQGEPNWVFTTDPVTDAAVETVAPEDRAEFPVIGHLLIEDGKLAYRDQLTDTDITATIATVTGQGGGDEQIEVEGRGRLQGQPLELSLAAGSLFDLRESKQPYPIALAVEAGEALAEIKGTLKQPLALEGVDLDVLLEGSGSPALADLWGSALPELPPYKLKAHLARQDQVWKLGNLQAQLGDSDISGAAAIDTSAEKPLVRADLQSTTLDINQLRNLLANEEASPGDETQDDETATLELAPLGAVNAEAELQIATLALPTLTVNEVSLQLRLENGRLNIDPLAVALGGGKAQARLVLDASGQSPQGSLGLTLQQVDLEQILETPQQLVPLGAVDGNIQLSLASGATTGPLTPNSLLQRLQVEDSELRLRDPDSNTDLTVTLGMAQVDGEAVVQIKGNGRYRDQPVKLTVQGDSLQNRDKLDSPYSVNGELTLASTQLSLDTTVNNPLTLEGINADLALKGGNPAELGSLAGVSLPDLPAYRIDTQIRRQGESWVLGDFQGNLGGSDLAGDVTIETQGERPLIKAVLSAETLDVQELLNILASADPARPSKNEGEQAEPDDLAPLRAVDAEIKLDAKRIIAPNLPLEDVSLQLKLDDGQLALKPLQLDVRGGHITADATLDARQWPLDGGIDLQLQQLNLAKLLEPFGLAEQQPLGIVDGRLNIAATSADPTQEAGDVLLPFLGQLIIKDSQLTYNDPATDLDVSVQIHTEGLGSDKQTVQINGEGRHKGEPFTLRFSGDPLLNLREVDEPYSLDLAVTAAETEAQLTGEIIQPLKLKGVDLKLALSGPDPERLSPLLDIPLPSLPPYDIKGQLVRQGGTWKLLDFTGQVGDSDLAGDIQVDTTGERPLLEAELTSRMVDFDDLASLIGAAPDTGAGETASAEQKREAAAEERREKVLPNDPINLAKINAVDAKVSFEGKRVEAPKLPLDDMNIQFDLESGRMTFKPLNFGIGDGDIRLQLEMDTNQRPPEGNFEAEIRRINLAEVLKPYEIAEDSVGIVGGRAKYWIKGNSLADFFATADGGLYLLMTGGKLDGLLVELAGLDAGEAIARLFTDKRNVVIDCAYADLYTESGQLSVETFLIDTADTLFLGDGSVDLDQERLDIVIEPKPKDISLLSAPSPLHIEGTFKEPDFQLSSAGEISQGAVAVTLEAVEKALGRLPLIAPDTDDGSAYCKGLVETMNNAR